MKGMAWVGVFLQYYNIIAYGISSSCGLHAVGFDSSWDSASRAVVTYGTPCLGPSLVVGEWVFGPKVLVGCDSALFTLQLLSLVVCGSL